MRIARLALGFGLMAVAFPVGSATITVGKDFTYDFWDIQAGIDAAKDGDTVVVYPGVYEENVEFRGAEILLISSNATSPGVVVATVIDGGGTSPTVTFAGTESPRCILAGFTIRNGRAAGGNGASGGGIRGRGTRARIEANVITGNTAEVDVTREYGHGGGIADCHGPIRYNVIAGNSVIGLYGQGGGLYNCDGEVDNNLVVNNSVQWVGGGLSGCEGWIRNNTIVQNHGGREGGGMAACDAVVENCIVTSNTADSGPDQIQAGAAPRYSCIEGWTGGGEGNLTSAPLFVDPDGPDGDPDTINDNDYRLSAQSPCVDTGKLTGLWGWPVRDLDGNCRLVGAGMDMGCYERGSTPDRDGDLLSDADEAAAETDPDLVDTDGDGLVDGLEIVRGTDPNLITARSRYTVPDDRATIEEAIGLAATGDVILVRPGTYHENIHFGGKDVVLRSPDPKHPATVAATILDGGGRGPVVSFSGTESNQCILSGFTITGGRSIVGAGIKGGSLDALTGALIENSIIRQNTSTGNGGGICFSQGVVRNNTVENNEAARIGGGLAWCTGVMEGNEIRSNRAGRGGGIAQCNGIIRNNTVTGNSTTEDTTGHGGGLYDCSGAVWHNLIADNQAKGDGGGLAFCTGTLRNNIVARNSCLNSGGGMAECGGTILNNTIAENTTDWNAGGLFRCEGEIGDSIVWANTAKGFLSQIAMSSTPTYCCIQGWTSGGAGNIAAVPQFADGAYRLAAGSPCIDAGNPDPSHNDWVRPPGLGGVRNDMGAYGGPLNGGWFEKARDLTGTLTAVGPSRIITGQEINLSGVVVNAGDRDVEGPFWVELWAVNKATRWTGYLCDSISIGSLGAGETFDLSTVLPKRKAYETIPTGNYAIEMRIDATNAFLEGDELNNVEWFEQVEILPDLPDLFPSLVDFRPEDISPNGGDMMTFGGRITNQGTQAVTEDFWIEVFVWPRGTGGASGVQALCDSYRITRDLQPWDYVDLFDLPGHAAYPLPRGVYVVAIAVDRLGAVAEQRDDNNVGVIHPRVLYVGPRPTRAERWKLYK